MRKDSHLVHHSNHQKVLVLEVSTYTLAVMGKYIIFCNNLTHT